MNYPDLEAELLDAPLGLAEALLRLAVPALLAVQLLLHGAHTVLQLGDHLPAGLDGVLLGLVHPGLQGRSGQKSPPLWRRGYVRRVHLSGGEVISEESNGMQVKTQVR